MGYLINGCSQKINKIINNYNNNQLWSLNNKNEICSWEFKIQENINNNNFFVKNYKFDFNLIDFEWANENYLILLETKNCYLYNISYNELIVLNQHEGHSFQSLIVKNLTDELILIIIVLDNYELISYKVKIEDNKIQSIESIKMEKLPNLIDEKKLKNYYLLSNLYYLNQETECNEYSISLVYYNEMENKLEIYYNYLTNSNYKWYKQNEVKVNLENIKKIEFSNFGLVFIVGTNEKKQTIIKIMDIKFNSFNFIKQWEFNWNNESIKNIQFLVTLFYYPMIIIITEFKIYILNFYKYKFIISNILYLPVNLYTNIDWFKILNDGTLYIKIEEQIYMFGKWIAINEIERDDETKLSKSIYSNNIINTIHTLSADYQNLLLNYHPNYLLEYIEWGKLIISIYNTNKILISIFYCF
ncbi:hypothetical protein K502DRAFT_133916 [Neoconidiobolus thromboides FSU 785]|nr:hypothetical protein K502DRAFT_133916 [Neoconidiobolus thromboides FSU 785]